MAYRFAMNIKTIYLNLSFFVAGCLFSNSALCQHVSNSSKKNSLSVDTLVEKSSQKRFFISNGKTQLTAINKFGNILWQTKQVTDDSNRLIFGSKEKLDTLMIAKVSFSTVDKKIIQVVYNNNLRHTLDIENGKIITSWKD